jgi:hypothetical protein
VFDFPLDQISSRAKVPMRKCSCRGRRDQSARSQQR